MIRKPQKSISELFREGTPIDQALARAARDALLLHKRIGNAVAVWRDGRVVHIPADQIQIPPLEDAPE